MSDMDQTVDTQQLARDIALLHAFVHGAENAAVSLGGVDTPTLREVWRTAPYLFDGRAATMEEVFEVHRHGIERKISKREIEELTEYVNSL